MIHRAKNARRKGKIHGDLVGILFVFLVGAYVLAPKLTAAVADLGPRLRSGAELALEVQAMQNETKPFGALPTPDDGLPTRVLTLPVTAYSSDVWQTDATPTVTASGTSVRRGIVAANFVPIGTRIRLPELFGDEVFVVEDRMHGRFARRVDVWMEETADAQNFGFQWTTVEVF